MQRNWIGYEEGKYVYFKINDFEFATFLSTDNKEINSIIVGINNKFTDLFKDDCTFNNWVNENSIGSVSQKNNFSDNVYFHTNIHAQYEGIEYPIFIDMNKDDESSFEQVKNINYKKGRIATYFKEENGYNIKLKDWGISRQRYWGNPIPIINCFSCGEILSEDFVKLPTNLTPGRGGNVLENNEIFVNCICPKCGKPAKRCTDTMDTFVQSAWYFHNYVTRFMGETYGIKKKDTQIDHYIGGIEHATMHLIYARFFHKMLRDLGYVSTDEPIKKLTTQGMVCKKYINDKGMTLSAKMSKSIGNVVEPKDYIEKYGSDALQMFMIFAAPPDKNFDFEDAGIVGTFRFLDEVYHYFFIGNTAQKNQMVESTEKIIDKMETMFENEFEGRFNLNVLIPQLMIVFKSIKKTDFKDENKKRILEARFNRCLSIFAPKISFYIEKFYFLN